VSAPKTDAISRATLGFRQYRLSFYPTDLKPQISNLEVGIKDFFRSYEQKLNFEIYREIELSFACGADLVYKGSHDVF
jgi:hypothetical protein